MHARKSQLGIIGLGCCVSSGLVYGGLGRGRFHIYICLVKSGLWKLYDIPTSLPISIAGWSLTRPLILGQR